METRWSKKPVKILMVASEVVPFMRTSDVATVVAGLSKALLEQGHDVRIVIPHYRTLHLEREPRPIATLDVPLSTYTISASLGYLEHVDIPIYLIGNPLYFDREAPYGYLDDYERFIFFTRAVVEMLRHDGFVRENWYPDILHGHDWIAGFLPWWLKYTYKEYFSTHPVPFVYTIHNASFLGQSGYRTLTIAGLTELGIYKIIGEQPDRVSFLTRGVLAADVVNTVSSQHAQEILHEPYAQNLAEALAISDKPLHGILNGLDYETYNPAFDDIITHKFDRHKIFKRKENKGLLQAECDLTVDPAIPMLGFIGRLISDKGVGLLEKILPILLSREEDVQVMIVGVIGDYHY